MERYLIADLLQWRNSKNRKPLIMRGVRQVGKTWALKEFGKRYYENVAYFNFDEQTELLDELKKTKDTKRLLEYMTFVNGKPILPEKTLIILDEIQECNEALNSLKYFYENAPEYHVACAGSLLGIALSRPASFPVGKVNFMDVHPMAFTEFLLADGECSLVDYINSINSFEPIPEIFYSRLCEKLKMYFITGGMPESVAAWTEGRDPQLVQRVTREILDAYELDFSKHAATADIPKLRLIWSSIPSQLAKENKKFIFSAMKQGARAREYEDAMTWICNAGMAYKIYRNNKPALPVSAYDDTGAFKLYMVDVGILRRLAGLDVTAFGEGNRLFTEFKGALAENFVLQAISANLDVLPRYWTSKATAEVDFIVQLGNDIYPIEVKSDSNVKSRSLRMYIDKYHPRVGIRFSLLNLKWDNDILNIPLFLAEKLRELTRLV
jgi:predicted AAA+ superfamily ATPase